ncbi:uncharacterized protein UV8b_06621 [Ustilaginoidea virens]|uniref:DUF1996 domain-containing protein n=1 Tax=Ustilaginoidea virens TaxID=1159556 RepID=A0A8E5HVY2_USTVR|nr:uncharacterized protein UV8b_06621 [Ustilaginoidea virens]QUC22380.1 hypothetical protein UV8b_06621 [Ustilaginoidea virens]
MMLRSVTLSASLIAGANAFWRMECPGRVGLTRLDPIVNPNSVSPHVHAIHGSSGFSDNSNTLDLLEGDCTSCRVTQDKSSYWTPALYFQDNTTGNVELVPQVGGMLAYYLLYGNNVTAFPQGFRMISGSNDRRSYTAGDPSQPDPPKSQWASLGQTTQSILAERAVGFNCLNYARNPEGTLYRHFLPEQTYLDANCADGLRLELMFPSCWNGKDLDSKNHKDHLAFPDLVMTGNCPDGYPVRLPSMLYEVIWNTAAYKGRNGRFVLSNGDTTGYSYHGDFVTGWDTPFLQRAIDTCTNPSGRIEDCPLFNVVDQETATSCKLKPSLPQLLFGEDVIGPMAKLPGGIPVGGMAQAPAPSSSTQAAPVPILTYRPGSTPSAPASPLPGDVFKEKIDTSSAAAAEKQPSSSSVATSSVTTSSATTSAASSSVPTSSVTTSSATTSAASSSATTSSTTSSTTISSVTTSFVTASSVGAPSVNPTTTTPPSSATPSYYSTQYITDGNVVTEILWEESYVTVIYTGGSPAATAAHPARRKLRRRAARHGHLHGKFR